MKVTKELIEQWHNEGDHSLTEIEVAQRAAEWALSQPVSMEPVLWAAKESQSMWGKSDDGGHPYHIITKGQKVRSHQIPLYTQSQLAAARQQGAEDQTDKTLEAVRVASERIAELEKSNAQLLEALKSAYKMAVDQDNSKPVDWALYCEFLYQSIKAAEVKP